jgi:hypothetical protein
MPKLSIPGVRAAAAAALLLFSAPPLAAQTVLRGELVDEHTGRPISGARVRLLSADSRPLRGTLTDSLGHFSFPVRQAGAYRLHAERIGYRPTLTPHLRLAAGDTLQVEFRLAVNAVLLAPVEIVARSRARANPVLEGFYVRRQRGFGQFVSREEIEQRSPFYITDILGTVPGVRVAPGGRTGSRNVYMARSAHGDCPVQIYLDGALVNRPVAARRISDSLRVSDQYANLEWTIDDMVSPSSVEGIEIYRGLSEVPAEFGGPNAHCGVIAVWTKRGTR